MLDNTQAGLGCTSHCGTVFLASLEFIGFSNNYPAGILKPIVNCLLSQGRILNFLRSIMFASKEVTP